MGAVTVHVKAAEGSKITLEVELGVTVGHLKSMLARGDKANVPAQQQRLIYRGHVLKDEKTLESYGACQHTRVTPSSGSGTEGARESSASRPPRPLTSRHLAVAPAVTLDVLTPRAVGRSERPFRAVAPRRSVDVCSRRVTISFH